MVLATNYRIGTFVCPIPIPSYYNNWLVEIPEVSCTDTAKRGSRGRRGGSGRTSGGGSRSGSKGSGSGGKGSGRGKSRSKGPSSSGSKGGGTKSGSKGTGTKGTSRGPGGPSGPSGGPTGQNSFSAAMSGFASSFGGFGTQTAKAAPAWHASQTGTLGTAIAASKQANPGAWGKALGTSGVTLKSFSTALEQGKDMSARPTKFTLKTKHIKEGGFDLAAATKDFFAVTQFSWLPSAAAESDDKKAKADDGTSLGITVGEGYLVTGGQDMQNKAAQGLTNIAGMFAEAEKQGWYDNQQRDKEGNIMISPSTWKHLQSLGGTASNEAAPPKGYVIGKPLYKTEKSVIRPIADVDPLGTWHGQYMQKYPDMYVIKSSEVGVRMPEGISKQLEKWQGIIDSMDAGAVMPGHPVTGEPQSISTAYAMRNLYASLVKDIHYRPDPESGEMVAMHLPKHQAIQSGMTGEYTFGGVPVRFNPDGSRLILSKEKVSLAGQLTTNPDSLSADQKKEAKIIKQKLDQSHYEFQTDAEGYTKYDQSKDTVGDPYHSMNVMGYDTGVWSTPKTVKREDIVWGDNDEYVSGGHIIYTHETDAGIIESTSQYIDKATSEAFTPAYDATSIDTSKYSIGEHQYVDRPASTVEGGKKGDFGVQPIGTVVSEKHTDPKTGMVSVALTSMEKAQLKLTQETGHDTFNPDGSLFATMKQPVVGSLSEWVQVGGHPSGAITLQDEYLRQKYTIGGGGGKKSVIPANWGLREMVSMIDTNEDGVPDTLSIAPWTTSTHPSAEDARYVPLGGWGGGAPGEGGGAGDPGMVPGMTPGLPPPPAPYEVPYYVDIGKAQEMLEAGMTIEDIMAKPPLSSEYMYWTDPTDKIEYVMTLTDYQEYLDAMASQKKVEKQRKYDEVFMDVTRSSHRPQTQIRRRKSGAGPAINRVMAGTAPSEADIGGLVK